MEPILITGGAGFIGSNIAEALISRDYKVVVVDDLSTGKTENIKNYDSKNFKFIKGDICNAELLRSIIKSNNVKLICHQAARPSVAKSIEDPIKTAEINIIGTVTVFKSAVDCGCKRVVFASSSSVYGDTPELPKRESMLLKPKSPYAVSKATKEMFADVFTKLYNIEIVGLRYFNVYGRRQDPKSDYAAVIPKFITKALRNEDIPVEGDGLQTRDFSYIDDVLDANIRALTVDNISGMFFNIACNYRISILDLARTIKEITQSKSEITFRPPRPGDVRDSLADIEKAKKYLGYNPKYPVREGLKRTVDWYKGIA
jgi:UDP-glucose 4-epimerase